MSTKTTAKPPVKPQAKPEVKPAESKKTRNFDPNEDGIDVNVGDKQPIPPKPKKSSVKRDTNEEQVKFEKRLETAATKILLDYDPSFPGINSRTFPNKLGDVMHQYIMSVLDNLRSTESVEAENELYEPLPANRFSTLNSKSAKKTTKPKKTVNVKPVGPKKRIIKGKEIVIQDVAEEVEATPAEETDTEEPADKKTTSLRNPVSLSPDAKLTLYYLCLRYVNGCQELLDKPDSKVKSVKTSENFVSFVVDHVSDRRSNVVRSVVGIVQQYHADVDGMPDGKFESSVGKVIADTLGDKSPSFVAQANSYLRMFMQILGRSLAYEVMGVAASRLQSINLGTVVARLRELDSRTHRYLTETGLVGKESPDYSLSMGFFSSLMSFKNCMIPPLTKEEKEKRKAQRKKGDKATKNADNNDNDADDNDADDNDADDNEAEGDDADDNEAEGDDDDDNDDEDNKPDPKAAAKPLPKKVK